MKAVGDLAAGHAPKRNGAQTAATLALSILRGEPLRGDVFPFLL